MREGRRDGVKKKEKRMGRKKYLKNSKEERRNKSPRKGKKDIDINSYVCYK